MNVLPVVFLEKLAQSETSNADSTEMTLGTVDVKNDKKNACLMADQPTTHFECNYLLEITLC